MDGVVGVDCLVDLEVGFSGAIMIRAGLATESRYE